MNTQPRNSESQLATTHGHDLPFADGRQIACILLTTWLDWVTRINRDVTVALPMIQRGSVWGAKKIADLWDSLLRGMPIGSLTILRVDEPGKKRDFRTLDNLAQQEVLPVGSLFLLDGQQRTLAMCIGWLRKKEKQDTRVWVDFGQEGVAGQPFRLRVTTQFHPFGFDPNDHSKLKRHDRRMARLSFDNTVEGAQLKQNPDYKLDLSKTRPYKATLPLLLSDLIEEWRISDSAGTWHEKILHQLNLPENETKKQIKKRISDFSDSLDCLFKMEIALARVAPKLVDAELEENVVPPLIVLFNRIANAGEPLSPSDYIFSLIKHRFPEAHELVQKLHSEANVASLLSANDLVMTAVRLALNTNTRSGGQELLLTFRRQIRMSLGEFSKQKWTLAMETFWKKRCCL